jgi:hypothetical protein
MNLVRSELCCRVILNSMLKTNAELEVKARPRGERGKAGKQDSCGGVIPYL